MQFQQLTSTQITRRSGSNLALSFVSLTKAKRQAMSVFYAFCRVIDDAADDETLPLWEKRKQLEYWRNEIAAIPSQSCKSPLGRELALITHQYRISTHLYQEILLGVETDLTQMRYATFNDLSQYCYRVASAVGLVSIEIFGYKSPLIKEYAVALGMAFQLTNILRDVKIDAARGRIYLPQEELAEWQISESDILTSVWNSRVREYFRHFALRAEHYYNRARRYLSHEEYDNMLAAELMREIYWAILQKIIRNDYNVFARPIGLSKIEKLYLIFKNLFSPFQKKPRFNPPKKVLIIGAGWAGQAAALTLARQGHTVTLLEARKFMGGRAHSFKELTINETIDNGQHILMGCYRHTLKFLDELNVRKHLYEQEALELHFFTHEGYAHFSAKPGYTPFPLLAALFKFPLLNWYDRLCILRLCIKLSLRLLPDIQLNAREWLQNENQTAQAIKILWEPLCLAAINLPLETAAASLFAEVIHRTLCSSSLDARIILSRVGLTELIENPVKNFLRYCNGEVIQGQPAQSFEFEDRRIRSVRYGTDKEWKGDAIISAIPWHSLKKLIPQESDLFQICSIFSGSSILTWQLWFDAEIFPQPFVGLIDSPIHWIFNKNAFSLHPSKNGFPYIFVISGVESIEGWTSERLEKLALDECHRFFPASRHIKILHRYFYKSQDATFVASPSVEPYRPGVRTEWQNLVLAGDWTDTGLPATIEGAVQSGYRAAAFVDDVL
ncbi:MAG: hydroxysqualene dehydroxylase HpnE [Methylacidiphilales bacterium]|nr:hydroxysqualene dehydroxylase HpnE [Candidatus Methylacidiphilales bacterium]MDW8350085.1 hydroxysqualene dehydroxylase HpnE [Verrucomicrobiae bacterium]